jgi:hypothetical protein
VPVVWVWRIAGPIRRVASRLFSVSLTFPGLTYHTLYKSRCLVTPRAETGYLRGV